MKLRNTIGLSLVLLVASTPAMAKEPQPGHNHPAPQLKAKAKPAKAETAAARTSAKRHHAKGKTVARSESRRRHADPEIAPLPPPDRYVGPFQVIGTREVGSAAWYGGRHIGRRTASGERLDTVRATAAHRSLPLHSLVRVTNLNNGRSVIAAITDRGPVSRKLLIDVSPRAAKELDMLHTGIATVAIEPVAATGDQPLGQGH
jgi:peptidoglycan lytic transglycosylase